MKFTDGYFKVPDGLTLHYRDYPGSRDRPTLLCLHGLTRNARDFERFAERYSPEFRVIVLEFRGRGLSDRDPQPMRYTPMTYARDVLELLDHLKLPQSVFVGTSLGGLVTMGIAGIAPERIAAAILNDVGPELGQSGLDHIFTYLGKEVRFGSWVEAAEALSTRHAGAHPGYSTEDWLAMARRNCREEDGAVLFDYDMAIAEPFKSNDPVPKIDMWPLFAALAQKPLLVIRGALSELLSHETVEKMRSAAPNAQFALVQNVGHAPDLSEPEAAAAIDRFLSGLGQAG